MLCISMATTTLLVRFRTLEEYGTYSQLLLVKNLITTIFIMGLPNSINYFLARAETEEEKRKYLSTLYVKPAGRLGVSSSDIAHRSLFS